MLSRLVKGSPFRMLLFICNLDQVFGDAVSNIAILVLILSQGILTFLGHMIKRYVEEKLGVVIRPLRKLLALTVADIEETS